MLTSFRNRVTQQSGFVKLLADLMRLRATQIAAVTAVLLGLVQIGRLITGEPLGVPRARERYAQAEGAAPQLPQSRAGQVGALGRSDKVAAARPQDLALNAPPPPAAEAKTKTEGFAQTDSTIVTGP